MASLKWYLDRLRADSKERALYLRYKTTVPVKGSVSFYPGELIDPAQWKAKEQRPKGTGLEAQKFHARLTEYRTSVHNHVEALRRQSGTPDDPVPADVKRRVMLAQRGASGDDLAAWATLPHDGTSLVPLGEETLPNLMRRVCLLREGELRQSTRTQYGYGANCLDAFCPPGDPRWKLSQLSATTLEAYRQWMVRPKDSGGLGVDNQTCNNRMALVSATLRYFRDHDRAYRRLLDEELVLTCSRKFKIIKHVRTHLVQDELLAFYHAKLPSECRGAEYLVRDIYCLSWLTSLRQSDLFELAPHHVEYRNGVPVALNTTSIKSLKVTRLPVNALAAEILLRWLDRNRPEIASDTRLGKHLARFRWPSDRIFPMVSRTRHLVIKRLWERLGMFSEQVEVVRSKGAQHQRSVVSRAELLTLHTARHGFGNFMAANNVPIEDTKLFMGHSETKTTEIYYHRPEAAAFDRAQRALDRMNAVDSKKPD